MTDELVFEDHFDGAELDSAVWFPHYLPHWSSRAATAAKYEIGESCLQLSIPPEQGLWCGGDHTPPLRVSGIQSGNFSGPVGSTVGQQPYRDGLVVREEQEPFWGWTPEHGTTELRARADISPRTNWRFPGATEPGRGSRLAHGGGVSGGLRLSIGLVAWGCDRAFEHVVGRRLGRPLVLALNRRLPR